MRRNRTFNTVIADDRVWGGSRHGSSPAANDGFASFLENSRHSAIDPKAVIDRQGCVAPFAVAKRSVMLAT